MKSGNGSCPKISLAKIAKVTSLYIGYTGCIFILARTVTDSLNDKLIGKLLLFSSLTIVILLN